MVSQGWSVVFLVVLVIGAGLLLWWIWRKPSSNESARSGVSDAAETVVSPRLIFSSEEATIFNLVKLAVQDHFLILGKLSLLQLVSFQDKDEDARRAVMRNLQSIRLDVVLVHPGSRQAQMVIRFGHEKEHTGMGMVDERERLMETVLKAAGIGLVELSLDHTYSVEQLTGLLGLAEEE